MLHMNKTLSPPKPSRVSVPVDAEVLATFERLAKAGNLSTGRCMAEWLRDTVEAAELMASTMERARAAPKLVTAELHAMMLGMADQSKDLADQFSKFKGPIAEAVPRAPAGGRATGAVLGKVLGGLVNPPSCNTGGKVPQRVTTKRGGKAP